MVNGYMVRYDKDNKYVEIVWDENTETPTQSRPGQSNSQSIQSTPSNIGYKNESTIAIIIVIVFLTVSLICVLTYFQYKLVLCEKFLCFRFTKKNHNLSFNSRQTLPSSNSQTSLYQQKLQQMQHANHPFRQALSELPEEMNEDDSDSQHDHSFKHMLGGKEKPSY